MQSANIQGSAKYLHLNSLETGKNPSQQQQQQ